MECHPIANATEVNECILGTAEQVARAPAVKTFAESEAAYGEESDEAEVGEDQRKFYDVMLENRSKQWQPQGTWSASDALSEEMNSKYAHDILMQDLKAQIEQDTKDVPPSMLPVRRPLLKTGSTDVTCLPNSIGERKI